MSNFLNYHMVTYPTINTVVEHFRSTGSLFRAVALHLGVKMRMEESNSIRNELEITYWQH